MRFRVRDQALVIEGFHVLANQFHLEVAAVSAFNQRFDDARDGNDAIAQAATVLFPVRRYAGVSQLHDRDVGYQFGEHAKIGRLEAEVIRIEGQLDARMIQFLQQLNGLLQAGQEGEFGCATSVHRFDGERGAEVGRCGGKFGQGASEQPSGVVVRVATACATVNDHRGSFHRGRDTDGF